MLQKNIALNIETFNVFLRCAGNLLIISTSTTPQIDSGCISRLLEGVVQASHLPYLLELSDAYKFANNCLTSEFEETQALDKAMDSITGLRYCAIVVQN